MAVLAECLSVIVPISILEERFPGGNLSAFLHQHFRHAAAGF